MTLYLRILLLSAILCPTAASAVNSAKGAFLEAPDGIFPALSQNMRLDMLDYYNSCLKHPVVNHFGEPAMIDTITPGHISVRVADNSVIDISLMPLSAKDTAMVVITTLQLPATTSFVRVYRKDWTEYPDALPQPLLRDWVTPDDRHPMVELENMVPLITTHMTFDPTSRTVTATNTLDEYLTADDYSRLKPLLRPALTYRWNGKKFQLLKP